MHPQRELRAEGAGDTGRDRVADEDVLDDRRLLVLIGRMLKAKVVMPDGVKVSAEQGAPQATSGSVG